MFDRPAKISRTQVTKIRCVGAPREARSRDGVGASFLFYDRQGEIAE